MASQSDSFEGHIWNYQPAKKKRDKSTSIQSSSDASCHNLNDKTFGHQGNGKKAKSSNRKGSSYGKFTGVVKHDSDDITEKLNECSSSMNGKDVIDVDLEPDFEFSSLKTQRGPTILVNTSSQKKKQENGPQRLSHSSPTKTFVTSKIRSRSPEHMIKRRSNHNQSKSKTSSHSPVKKVRRISERETTQNKGIPSIKTYFSPKKTNSRTDMPIAEISDDPISLSDDEFLITKPDEKVSGCENQSTSYVTNDILDTKFGMKNTETRAGVCKVITQTSQACELAESEKDNCHKQNGFSLKSSQSHQETPSVDVNVVYDEESEQSSSEIENRSALSFEEKRCDTKYSVSEVLVIQDCDKLNDHITDCALTLSTAERIKKDLSVSCSNKGLNKSNANDVYRKAAHEDQCSVHSTSEIELAGGFFAEEDNFDACFNETEEIPERNVKTCLVENASISNKQMSFIGANSDKQCTILSDNFSLDVKGQNAYTDDNTSDHGGFCADKKAEEDHDVKSKNGLEDATENSNKKPASLLPSASWPSISASATKQTTLFSFLKAKPGTRTLNISDSTKQACRKSSSVSSMQSSSSAPLTSERVNVSDMSHMYEESFKGDGKKKACPFYKKIPGTTITVDAFRYGVIPGCEAYVLTHFHYDHYGGLIKKFSQPIFCSKVTGNLVESRIGVEKKWINCLPMWKPCKLAGITLTLMEANHCPGAVIILFELNDGRKILHTGDFRASPEMETYNALQGVRISELYLDTTYCNPAYAFPDQSEVVHFVVDLVLKHIADHPSTLVVCGAYTIGKERIFAAIAKSLDSKICVMNDKKKVLDCLEDKDLKSRVTLDWSAGRVHVLPMGKLNQQQLREHHARHHRFENVLAFQPTGWTHSDKQTSLHSLKPKWSKDGITLYGVPYSEHSSFLELKRFVQHFRPLKILPTVNNGSPASRAKMEAIFKEWMQEKIVQKM